MPGAPRPNNKSKKIAYRILGNPVNSTKKRKRKNDKVEKRLVFEESNIGIR